MSEYTPYLLTADEADLIVFKRSFEAAKHPLRGLAGPSSGTPVGLPTVAASPEVVALLNSIIAKVDNMSETFDAELMKLRDDVAAQGTVIASATTAFQGLAAKLLAAEVSAKAAGATDAMVAGLATVRAGLEANTASLANAIPANTPAAAPAAGAAPASGASGTTGATGDAPATGEQAPTPNQAAT